MRVRLGAIVVLVAFVAFACSDSGGSEGSRPPAHATPSTAAPTTIPFAEPSAGCESPAAANDELQSMTIAGAARTYRLAVPDAPTGTPVPLIVLLHGLGSSIDDIVTASDLPARATARGAARGPPRAAPPSPSPRQPGPRHSGNQAPMVPTPRSSTR